MDNEAIVREVGSYLVDSIKEELRLQGHVLTGKLSDSIHYEVSRLLDGFELDIFMEHYGKFVDQGVAASNIPYSPGGKSGARTSKYIQGLVKFVKLRKGISSNEKALRVAFAIAATQKKEGSPTLASRKYSKRGKRTGFLSDTLDDSKLQVEELVNKGFDEQLEILFENLITLN